MSTDAPYKVVFAKRANRDLEGVADALAVNYPEAAEEMLDALLASIDSLAMFPHRNVVDHQPHAAGPVRSLPVPPYMVYFRADDRRQLVRVLRVRHGARRPLRRLE